MHVFDFSEVRGPLPPDIPELIARIREINALNGVRASRYRAQFSRIEGMAKLNSVKFSNEIEGIVTSDQRLADIVLRNDAPRTHGESEIAGYRDALSAIHTDPSAFDLDEATVLGLHRTMMSHTIRGGGRYKTADNAIVSVSQGRREVVYVPVPASETPDAMEQLFLAYMDARDQGMEPLLLIPCAILDFLCVHPFQDGNGRTSRLLTTAMLYNSGFDVCRYVSLDERISLTKGSYYRALGESSAGWRENRWTYVPFVRYFLRSLLECHIDLDTRFAVTDDGRLSKHDRVARVVENSLAPVSKRQICAALPDVSPRTVEAALADLRSDGMIEKVGTYRDARYRWVGHRMGPRGAMAPAGS